MSRRYWNVGLVVVLAMSGAAYALVPAAAAEAPASRSAKAWPFAQNSIWNVPIGSGAVYRDADLQPATALGPTTEEDLAILTPDAPRQDVLAHNADWDANRTRCGSVVSPARVLLEDMPIPTNFVTDPGYLGRTPNQSTAILAADGRTVHETQPFHRCSAGGTAVSQYTFGTNDLFTGDGIRGSHGGSHMSALGGLIRVGELESGVLRHALKLTMWGKENYHCSSGEADGKPGYRWPAQQADGGACDPNSFNSYDADDPGVQMGTLLALPPGFDVSSLRTEPARVIAKALQDYGAYLVDNIGWDAAGLAMEWGPAGRVRDDLVNKYGIHMEADRTNPPTQATADFIADFDTLIDQLNYIDNNSPDNIGGGGTRRAPLAPPFNDVVSTTGTIVGLGGRCLDVDTGTTGDGRKVQMWTCHAGPNQKWTRTDDDTLRSEGSCLDVRNGGTADGTAVQLWTCNGSAAQRWEIRSDGTIRNPQSGRCLDVKDSSTTDGALVQIWSCHASANQKWTVSTS